MTLLELCEPLFLYICRLNRSARKGGAVQYDQVRAEVEAIFKQMHERAAAEPRLITQYEKIERPLTFFVDSIIAESDLPFAKEWHRNRRAYDFGELAGDDRFWELLDETLEDRSPEATERLAVFYTCIGLGFTGFYAGQSEYLRNKMLQISARLQGIMDSDVEKRICPEAYEHVDTSNLFEPPGVKLMGIGLVLVGLSLVLFVTNIFLFRWTSEELVGALEKVLAHKAAVTAAGGPQATEAGEGGH